MTEEIACESCGEIFPNVPEWESNYYCENCGSTNPKFKSDFIRVVAP